jgi:hypothetical protein
MESTMLVIFLGVNSKNEEKNDPMNKEPFSHIIKDGITNETTSCKFIHQRSLS